MDFVLVKRRMSKKQYDGMTKSELNKILDYYHGRLIDIIETDDEVVLLISAPSTWRTLLVSALLIPYRYI